MPTPKRKAQIDPTAEPAEMRPERMKARLTSRELQREATKRRILQSALRAFAAKGFAGAGTREIAAGAGVRQALINHYFDSKQELWKAALSSLIDELEARLRVGGVRDPERPVRERLVKLVRIYAEFSAEHPEHGRLMQLAGIEGGPLLQWLYDHHAKARFGATLRLIREAIGEGLLPEADPVFVLYMLNGAIQSIFLLEAEVRMHAGIAVRSPDVAREHADLVLRTLGLLTQPERPRARAPG